MCFPYINILKSIWPGLYWLVVCHTDCWREGLSFSHLGRSLSMIWSFISKNSYSRNDIQRKWGDYPFLFWCPIMCNHVCSSHFLWWARHQSESNGNGLFYVPDGQIRHAWHPDTCDGNTSVLLNKLRSLQTRVISLSYYQRGLSQGLLSHPLISAFYRCPLKLGKSSTLFYLDGSNMSSCWGIWERREFLINS